MKGHIQGLIDGFMEGNISQRLLQRLRNQEMKFPKELVEKTWNECASQENGIPKGKTRDDFIAILCQENILEL
jgi:hypothetical protein